MIRVKNVKIAESMSEETLCFTATVYENDVKIGTAKNYGCGGDTYINLDTPYSETYDEMSLEATVDELVFEIYNKKQAAKLHKKLERDCSKFVCVGRINEHEVSYHMQGFKSKLTLAEIVLLTGGLEALQSLVNRIKSEIKGDEQILNTNLEALGVRV